MPSEDLSAIARRLAALRGEERDLEREIAAASAQGDELALSRLRRRHARVAEMIAWLADKLIPDLDA
jgi:hypothetical protein